MKYCDNCEQYIPTDEGRCVYCETLLEERRAARKYPQDYYEEETESLEEEMI